MTLLTPPVRSKLLVDQIVGLPEPLSQPEVGSKFHGSVVVVARFKISAACMVFVSVSVTVTVEAGAVQSGTVWMAEKPTLTVWVTTTVPLVTKS